MKRRANIDYLVLFVWCRWLVLDTFVHRGQSAGKMLSVITIIDDEAITINERRSRARDKDTSLCRQKRVYPCSWEVEADPPAQESRAGSRVNSRALQLRIRIGWEVSRGSILPYCDGYS